MKNLVLLLAILVSSISFSQSPAVDVIRFDTNASDPLTPADGWLYMDTNHDLKIYNGTSWNVVGGASGVNVTDGTNTVNGVTDMTFTGGVIVSGTTPSATIDVSGSAVTATQFFTKTLTDHAIVGGARIEILPSPGVDKVYDIISMSVSKNLTTAYNADSAYKMVLGNGIITPPTGNDELFLLFTGIIFHKLGIVDYDGDAGDQTTPADTVGNSKLEFEFATSATGGIGTIKISVAYRILDL